MLIQVHQQFAAFFQGLCIFLLFAFYINLSLSIISCLSSSGMYISLGIPSVFVCIGVFELPIKSTIASVIF